MSIKRMDGIESLLILLPGTLYMGSHLQQAVADAEFIIAVDGGIEQAKSLEITPHLWVGDFDSTPKSLEQEYQQVERIRYPEEKDLLDSEIALTYALEHGVEKVTLIGGIGGALDHQAALLMMPLHYRNLDFFYLNGRERLYTSPQNMALNLATVVGERVSIIPLEPLSGVTLRGCQWPLHNESLPVGLGRTLSNRAIEDEISFTVASGRAWLYLS